MARKDGAPPRNGGAGDHLPGIGSSPMPSWSWPWSRTWPWSGPRPPVLIMFYFLFLFYDHFFYYFFFTLKFFYIVSKCAYAYFISSCRRVTFSFSCWNKILFVWIVNWNRTHLLIIYKLSYVLICQDNNNWMNNCVCKTIPANLYVHSLT